MKNRVIVFWVMVVSVAVPLAGFNVYLDIPMCLLAFYQQNGILEVTACAVGESARVYYPYSFARICHKLRQAAALPHICHEIL
jgi:hypothetical protein